MQKKESHWLKRLGSLLRWLETVSGSVSGMAIYGILAVTVVDVFKRYLLNSAWIWAYSLNELLMVVCVFPALALATREGVHVQFGLVSERLPPQLRKIVHGLQLTLSITFFALIGWQAVIYSGMALRQSMIYAPEFAISAAPVYMIIAFGSFLTCIRAMADFGATFIPSSRKDQALTQIGL